MATDADELADMLRVIDSQIGFEVTGEIQIFETELEQLPRDNPFGYGINFTPYE